jgi:energy-coupling factor transporter ATP-binding protein EcfA2
VVPDLDHIEVRGARENNLREVSVDIPKRAITVFTGVSGSGKSSLVFGTIAAESQRLINETYTAFIQSFMPNVGRPDVDTLRNLSAAILVDQERMGANSRSTVGTATDAYSMLRLIYSRLGEPYVGHSSLFSFNDPQGMCPECEGMGRVSTVDVDAMVDRGKSLNEGAITLPNFGVDSWQWRMYAESGHFDADKKLSDYTKAEWERFLHGAEEKVEIRGLNLKYEGLVNRFERTFLSKDVETAQPHIRAAIERVATFARCPECGGTRLNQAALGAKIRGRNIAECAAMQVDDLAQFLSGIEAPNVAPALDALRHTLDSLVEDASQHRHTHAAPLGGGVDGEHAELGLVRAADLAERPAGRHERHRAQQAPVAERDQQLRLGGAPRHVAQFGEIVVVARHERLIRGDAEVGDGRELGGLGMADLERHVSRPPYCQTRAITAIGSHGDDGDHRPRRGHPGVGAQRALYE